MEMPYHRRSLVQRWEPEFRGILPHNMRIFKLGAA